jgi:hypothetical protein
VCVCVCMYVYVCVCLCVCMYVLVPGVHSIAGGGQCRSGKFSHVGDRRVLPSPACLPFVFLLCPMGRSKGACASRVGKAGWRLIPFATNWSALMATGLPSPEVADMARVVLQRRSRQLSCFACKGLSSQLRSQIYACSSSSSSHPVSEKPKPTPHFPLSVEEPAFTLAKSL